MEKSEVKYLFDRLKVLEEKHKGAWLTLVNHRALYRLLVKVLQLPNEREGISESFEAYKALLMAMLVENSMEMQRVKGTLQKIDGDLDIRDAKIIMHQDVLDLNQFGENKKELGKAQILKFIALTEFGNEHKEVGEAIQKVVNNFGFQDVFNYLLLVQMPLSVYHDTKNFKEGLYYVRRQDYEQTNTLSLWEKFSAYVADKCIDIWDLNKMNTIFTEQELLDNTCFRKYPVLKISEEEFLIVSQIYYAQIIYDSFWWSLKAELESSFSSGKALDILTNKFSEEKLFYKLVKLMIGDKRIQVYNNHSFEAQQAAPDVAIKTRNNLFLFEYKDIKVHRKVSDGGNIDLLMDFLDERLNKKKEKRSGNKGLPQLISNMEDFITGKGPWKEFYGKGKVKIHPILVINSRLFGVRGINYIMQDKLHHRVLESEILRDNQDRIANLLVIDYDILILVVAWSYKDFGQFYNLLYSYQTNIRNERDIVTRCASFRQYVMNKWELEMTEKDIKKFEDSYKKVFKIMLSINKNN